VAVYLFYLFGHFLLGFPFPLPKDLFHLALGALAGFGLGWMYHRLWPLPPSPAWSGSSGSSSCYPPAFMLGIGLLILLKAQVALHLLVPLTAWLTPDYGPKDHPTPKGPA